MRGGRERSFDELPPQHPRRNLLPDAFAVQVPQQVVQVPNGITSQGYQSVAHKQAPGFGGSAGLHGDQQQSGFLFQLRGHAFGQPGGLRHDAQVGSPDLPVFLKFLDHTPQRGSRHGYRNTMH